MALASLSFSALIIPKPLLPHSHSSSLTLHTFFKWKNAIKISQLGSSLNPQRTAASVRAEFDISLFERDLGGSDAPPPTAPGAGFPDYETMVVLRPDMSEDERLAFTQKYEELFVAGGGMYLEVFNRGVIPFAYSIKKKNKAGESNTYLDCIYLLFTHFTKPESMSILGDTLLRDDDVIRSSGFKIRKRKLF
ncbi:hypothetical protein Pfo_022732 [Paulownia fortunei]|nr:hypothetical protein Pfo_022732 [Paulownia fortunei]